MSINSYILNLLNIKDENIHIITECKEKIVNGVNYKIIEGVLTYIPISFQLITLFLIIVTSIFN